MEVGTSQSSLPSPPQKSPFALNRIWLNIVLFVVTVFSTFFVGFSWSINFRYAETIFQNGEFALGTEAFFDPQVVGLSLLYAVTLIGILLSHELGHFLACRYYRIEATLPFFIPAPTIVGTMGAFIKIRSPITRKRQLFDIGVAGPLMGFCLSVPLLILGLSLSKAIPSVPQEGSIIFGEPLLLKLVGGVIFANVPSDFDVILHPIGFAGWVGILVTALNLFPIGQLDGGHILYAMIGKRSARYSRWILTIFLIMGVLFWIGWFVWALLIGMLGVKHPRIIDEDLPLSQGRKAIAFLVILIFILSFIPDPIKGYNLIDFLRQIGF